MNQLLGYIKEDFPDLKGNFLDIGSGYARLVTFMAEQTKMNCVGVEINPEMHNNALKTIWTNAHSRMKLLCDDIVNLPGIVESADVIYMNCVTWDPKLVSRIFQQANGIMYHNCVRAIRLDDGKLWDYPGEPAPLNCSWGIEDQKYYKLNTKTVR